MRHPCLVAEGERTTAVRVPRHAPLRVLVVDDHEVLRNGLRWLLSRVPWVERCAGARAPTRRCCSRGRSLRRRAGRRRPRRRVRAATCERLSATGAHTALLTSRWDLVADAHRPRGRRARRDRQGPPGARAARRGARAGRRRRLRARRPRPPGEVRFIPREREILRLVGAGLTNAEIGASLFLAPGTIKHHMLGLYDKLGAPNRAAAVHTARRLGVLADHRAASRSTAHRPVRGARARRRPRRRPPRRPPARAARPRVA